jgi:U3 small nucleolar RNA-associated protein 25
VFDHVNLVPKEQRDTDFSRLREFYINGLARSFRQTLVFSSFLTPEINAFFARHARSFEGKLKAIPDYQGSIRYAPPPPNFTCTSVTGLFC